MSVAVFHRVGADPYRIAENTYAEQFTHGGRCQRRQPVRVHGQNDQGHLEEPRTQRVVPRPLGDARARVRGQHDVFRHVRTGPRHAEAGGQARGGARRADDHHGGRGFCRRGHVDRRLSVGRDQVPGADVRERRQRRVPGRLGGDRHLQGALQRAVADPCQDRARQRRVTVLRAGDQNVFAPPYVLHAAAEGHVPSTDIRFTPGRGFTDIRLTATGSSGTVRPAELINTCVLFREEKDERSCRHVTL